MSAKPSQTERVIKAARSYKGVCRIDFLLPDVIDGGEPITNFPGRMWDAEQKGFSFEVIGKRNRCSIFRLVDVEDTGSGDDSNGFVASSETAAGVLSVDNGVEVAGCSSNDLPHAGLVVPPAAGDLSTGRLFEVGEPVSTHYEDEAA